MDFWRLKTQTLVSFPDVLPNIIRAQGGGVTGQATSGFFSSTEHMELYLCHSPLRSMAYFEDRKWVIVISIMTQT